jgi:hypothetical protein
MTFDLLKKKASFKRKLLLDTSVTSHIFNIYIFKAVLCTKKKKKKTV